MTMGRYVLYPGKSATQCTSTEGRASTLGNFTANTKQYYNFMSGQNKNKNTGHITSKYKSSGFYNNYNLVSDDKSMSKILSEIHESLGISDKSPLGEFKRQTKYYNRYKIPVYADALQKGMAHVFFVRPDCNLMNGTNSLTDAIATDPEYSYFWNHSPEVVKSLVKSNGTEHDFMLYLSNKASSFSLSDEYVSTDVYGKTYMGYKIAYGKHDVESKTAGSFEIKYSDDRDLHVYQTHKLWTKYISDVYQGKVSPKRSNIIDRILDYVSCCYYIVTAEDGETIIFWSKYYGVFPTTIPSNQYSWSAGSAITADDISISYMYSFKQDYNPASLIELNYNSGSSTNRVYLPTYDYRYDVSSSPWVGSPYVELVTDNTDPECPYTFKLRFMKNPK